MTMNALPVTSQPWMALGECRGSTTLFYADDKDSTTTRQAREVCDECPVKGECLEWALTGGPNGTGEDEGVWGGTSPRQRRLIRRQRAQVASIFADLRLVAS